MKVLLASLNIYRSEVLIIKSGGCCKMKDEMDPYKVFGIKRDANKDEIIKRYNLLLKKFGNKTNQIENNGIVVTKEDVDSAYNRLMGYDFESLADGKLLEDANREPNRIFKMLNIDQKKFVNFMFYYKKRIIVITLACIFLFTSLGSMLFKQHPDLKMVLIGKFDSRNLDTIEKKIKDSIDGLKKVDIDPIVLWDDKDPAMYSAMEMKLPTIIAYGNSDIYLLSKEFYDELVIMDRFAKIDDLKWINIQRLNKKVLRSKTNSSDIEMNYGIDISGSKIFAGSNLEGKELILAFGKDGKHPENAKAFVELAVYK